MAKFITLPVKQGEDIIINIEYITSIRPENNHCRITLDEMAGGENITRLIDLNFFEMQAKIVAANKPPAAQ